MDITAPHFKDSDAAREFLEAQRWPEGTICPHCGVLGTAYKLNPKEGSKRPVRKGVWKCKDCRKQFTVTVGTIFADSHIALHKWLLAIHLMCASKKGMSAHQLHRMLGVTYKSAWFMAHRIRYAMAQEPLSSKLSGVVEADETFIGGKERGRRGVPGPESKKTPVLAMVERSLTKERKGRVRSVPVERVTVENLRPVLKETISPEANLQTDEALVYYFMRDHFEHHDVITHKRKKYVRYEGPKVVTTNTVEGFFAILKPGVNGTYHHVSRRHLGRYLTEFDFRYNARDVSDSERAAQALRGAEGKRLM